MRHRHLNHERHTPAAIDDIIGRGLWNDWLDLSKAILADPALHAEVGRLAAYRAETCPRGDHHRYVFWREYVGATA